MENLDKEKDIELINKIKQNIDREGSLSELVDRHSGIYYKIINSYLRNDRLSMFRNDFFDEKEAAIYNAAMKYDDTRNTKFSTFLGNEARWACLNTINKSKKNPFVCVESKVFRNLRAVEEESVSPTNKEEVLSSFFERAEEFDDKRVPAIFKLRYKSGDKTTPWRKVSEELKMSIQGCINIHDQALKVLTESLKDRKSVV